MNKEKLVEKFAEAAGEMSKAEAERMIMGALGIICQGLCDDGEVWLCGIGKLKVVEKPARICRNPVTGEVMNVPARKVVKLVAAKALRDRVNGQG